MHRALPCHGRDFNIKQCWIFSLPLSFLNRASRSTSVKNKTPWDCNRKDGFKNRHYPTNITENTQLPKKQVIYRLLHSKLCYHLCLPRSSSSLVFGGSHGGLAALAFACRFPSSSSNFSYRSRSLLVPTTVESPC